ncbi:CHASE3 domain-containing protein [Pseudodesulfovibrio sp.]|nr:CHASE3 domain-containing protein [Pseudodesulfovibrio sp.]
MRVKSQFFIGNAIILGVFLVVSIVSIISIRSLITNSKWVSHTYDVIGATNELLGYVVDQETGVRGYMATGDEVFLEPYHAGKNKFAAKVIMAKELVSDNPAAVAHFEKIQRIAGEWEKNVIAKYITARQAVNAGETAQNALLGFIASGEGKRRMDAFRASWKKVIDGAPAGRVKDACWGLLTDMFNMETGMRGYLVTGNEVYLEPFNEGVSQFEKRFSILERSGLPGVKNLQVMAMDWVNLAGKKTIDLKKESLKYPTVDTLRELMGSRLGKRYVDTIRETVAAIIDGENALLVVREDAANTTASQSIRSIVVGGLIAALVVLGFMLLVVRNISRPIVADLEFAKAIADGDLEATIEVQRNDELGDLARALNRMASNLKDIDWLKHGKEGLDDELRGEHEINAFVKRVVTYLTKHLDAQIGAFYLREGNTLSLKASHAFTDRHGAYETYELGEGMVGQSGLDNDILVFTNVEEDAPAINYGAAEAEPTNYMTIPISAEGEVFGVLLLGTVARFSQLQRLFVEQNAENIAVLFKVAKSRETIRGLLADAQRNQAQLEKANAVMQEQTKTLEQSEAELQAQQEELRVSNEELEEQTRALKQSKAELQAQQEELRMSNEELEAHIKALDTNT